MHRFPMNRWWTLIVTLTLCLASFAGPRIARADDSNPSLLPDPQGGGNDNGGDPDVPDGPGKVKGSSGGPMLRGRRVYALRQPVGDGTWSGTVVMWRLRVVAWSLRTFFVRF